MPVLVSRINQSPWPEMAKSNCDGQEIDHTAEWVIWTEEETGDGMRFACDKHIGGWVMTVWERIDGW
jgi:hypothetical protein